MKMRMPRVRRSSRPVNSFLFFFCTILQLNLLELDSEGRSTELTE